MNKILKFLDSLHLTKCTCAVNIGECIFHEMYCEVILNSFLVNAMVINGETTPVTLNGGIH